jgi:hypothetical protein
MTLVKSFRHNDKTLMEDIRLRFHRTHRSKKNSRPYPLNKSCSIYKEKLRKLKWEVDWGLDNLNKV